MRGGGERNISSAAERKPHILRRRAIDKCRASARGMVLRPLNGTGRLIPSLEKVDEWRRDFAWGIVSRWADSSPALDLFL
jgi:hypothetical protein